MKGRFLVSTSDMGTQGNIFANKSAIVLHWLLTEGVEQEQFSIREVAQKTGVSVGLVQKVFRNLVYVGILNTEGVRTSKRFTLKKPQLLLKQWLQAYDIMKKCKMWTYRSAFENRKELINALEKSKYSKKVALALHSAAKAHGYKNTNLESIELYLLDPLAKSNLEKELELKPQEKGYEVLIILPYYKRLLKQGVKEQKTSITPPLLTFLDLFHFPLRGLEQAEFMAERLPELKRIYKKS